MNTPLVSIIIPTFNREKLLVDAINSVKNQIYKNWELIVVDDNSIDNTKKVIEKYEKRDDRIRYLLNIRKKGPSGARNCGILSAKGKYIAFLDSDDIWFPHHLRDGVKVLESHNINVCFALWLEQKSDKLFKIDEDPYFKKIFDDAIINLDPRIEDNLIFFEKNILEYIILQGFYCYHINTLILNREVIKRIGLFDESMFNAEDMDFMFRVFHFYTFCLINDYHFIYNEGKDNIYKFIDRQNIDIDRLINNKKMVGRLTKEGKNDIIMKKNLKKLVLKSHLINDKKRCIKTINSLISNKYFTLGFLNINNKKTVSLFFMMISLLYELKRTKLEYFLKILFTNRTNRLNIQNPDLDFF